jgi:hypothetical protein
VIKLVQLRQPEWKLQSKPPRILYMRNTLFHGGLVKNFTAGTGQRLYRRDLSTLYSRDLSNALHPGLVKRFTAGTGQTLYRQDRSNALLPAPSLIKRAGSKLMHNFVAVSTGLWRANHTCRRYGYGRWNAGWCHTRVVCLCVSAPASRQVGTHNREWFAHKHGVLESV